VIVKKMTAAVRKEISKKKRSGEAGQERDDISEEDLEIQFQCLRCGRPGKECACPP